MISIPSGLHENHRQNMYVPIAKYVYSITHTHKHQLRAKHIQYIYYINPNVVFLLTVVYTEILYNICVTLMSLFVCLFVCIHVDIGTHMFQLFMQGTVQTLVSIYRLLHENVKLENII